MNLQKIFSSIKQTLTITRDVTIGDYTITLSPLTAEQEIEVMEACKDFDGAAYLVGFKLHTIAYAVCKMNGEEIPSEVELSGTDDQKPSKMTRHLFLLKMFQTWESAIRDMVYEVYSDLLLELDDKIEKTAKFKRFVVAKTSEEAGKEEEPLPGFKKVEESKSDLTDAEKLSEQVRKEVDNVQIAMSQQNQEAINRAQR